MLLSYWLSLFECVFSHKCSCRKSKDQDLHVHNIDSLRNHSITLTWKCHSRGCRQPVKDNRIVMNSSGKSRCMARGWLLLSERWEINIGQSIHSIVYHPALCTKPMHRVAIPFSDQRKESGPPSGNWFPMIPHICIFSIRLHFQQSLYQRQELCFVVGKKMQAVEEAVPGEILYVSYSF